MSWKLLANSTPFYRCRPTHVAFPVDRRRLRQRLRLRRRRRRPPPRRRRALRGRRAAATLWPTPAAAAAAIPTASPTIRAPCARTWRWPWPARRTPSAAKSGGCRATATTCATDASTTAASTGPEVSFGVVTPHPLPPTVLYWVLPKPLARTVSFRSGGRFTPRWGNDPQFGKRSFTECYQIRRRVPFRSEPAVDLPHIGVMTPSLGNVALRSGFGGKTVECDPMSVVGQLRVVKVWLVRRNCGCTLQS